MAERHARSGLIHRRRESFLGAVSRHQARARAVSDTDTDTDTDTQSIAVSVTLAQFVAFPQSVADILTVPVTFTVSYTIALAVTDAAS
jgi:hypothetical protein